MGIIYKATFQCNNKSYIGQTTGTLEKRKAEHFRDSQRKTTYFYCAIKSHGWEDLKWEIIEECPNEKLNEREIYWIDYYKTYMNFSDSKGYNMTLGGESGTPPIFFSTQEEINKLLEEYKEYGDIGYLTEMYNCSYTVIYNILTGLVRTEFTHFKENDKTFLHKYMKKGLKYSNTQIDEVLIRNKNGESCPDIAKDMDVPIKWVQDILSGRTLSKKTGISKVTREERQYYNPVNSKRTKEEVLQMVEDFYKNGLKNVEICEKYNINSARLSEILMGKTWNKITSLTREIYDKEDEKRNPPKVRVRKKEAFLYTDEQILQMVSLYKEGKTKQEIAEKYNTTTGYVYKIITRQRRKNVTHIK